VTILDYILLALLGLSLFDYILLALLGLALLWEAVR
jgi:hypothetical protein